MDANDFLDAKELLEEIESLETDIDELEELTPPNDVMMVASIKYWVESLRLVAAIAKKIAEKPETNEDTINILRMILTMADVWRDSVAMPLQSRRRKKLPIKPKKKATRRK